MPVAAAGAELVVVMLVSFRAEEAPSVGLYAVRWYPHPAVRETIKKAKSERSVEGARRAAPAGGMPFGNRSSFPRLGAPYWAKLAHRAPPCTVLLAFQEGLALDASREMATRSLGPDYTPFEALGLEGARALATRFYDHMDAHEPALVAVHRRTEDGTRVAPIVRERFAAFLVEWLGGPSDYSQANGHPRLRVRHGHVKVDVAMRDAWLRCMNAALHDPSVPDDVRTYLGRRFAEVADFLRNV